MDQLTPVTNVTMDKDIDLVLITGAGASREFGTQGTKLPLMGDWSEALIAKLGQKGPDYLEVTGLHGGMSGPEFEAQLGQFLQQVAAFPMIESIVGASINFQSLRSSTIGAQGVLDNWHSQVLFQLKQIVESIRESLYDQFAEDKCDVTKATNAYRSLFEALGISGHTKLVYATTNYDLIGESVIERLGALPDWGQPARISFSGEVPLNVSNILNGMPRYTPVLHLHGRVGWYRRIDPTGKTTSTYSTSVMKHQQGLGDPIVMLPNPDKIYDDELISPIWDEFKRALRRAKAVLVLGHSLNDKALVDAIISNVDRLDRVAVTALDSAASLDLNEKIKGLLDGVEVITPLRFGSDEEGSCMAVTEWMDNLRQEKLP